ncbi:26S proteasome non-ATPase regulatory subunit 9-like [Watersipora subatra]|uniref:26S proteasome non-ATPase regulatory subunit 9-like n=1 Tax=Watersipora subatra TaxID=2589382 RepID=UPI00355BCBEA
MEELQSEYEDLCKQKDTIEEKIANLTEILNCNGNVGMDEPLVDGDGYPRSDIDVYSVRHSRHQIICLQNDHKGVMKDLEAKLYQIHDCARKTQTVSSGVSTCTSGQTVKPQPFLTVNQVMTASPAAHAGLQTGDLIKEFGSVNSSNFKNLQDIALVVQHSKDKVVKLLIEREGQDYRLELTPRVWSGRGLLGCNVVEYKKP